MQTRHFIHDPAHLVNSSLRSLTLTNPSLAFDPVNKIIYRRWQRRHQNKSDVVGRANKDNQDDGDYDNDHDNDHDDNLSSFPKVAIVSGGGSGHEPAVAGLVGRGLLTASVAGTIFASPSAAQVFGAITDRATRAIPANNSNDEGKGETGVLVLVLNYTGDVLNFGMAVEKARATHPHIPVEFCAVGDDVAVGRKQAGKVGRRGIAGFVLVTKMCGALAELGGSVSQVAGLARLATANVVSIGASLEHVHVPGRPTSDHAEQYSQNRQQARGEDEQIVGMEEVELGMGIHNEPGSRHVNASLPELVKMMLAQLLDQNDIDRAFTSIDATAGDHVVLLINNLGGVSALELGGIVSEVSFQLQRDYQLLPKRTISGTFLTSLNGMGFSISILKLVSLHSLWDGGEIGKRRGVKRKRGEGRARGDFETSMLDLLDHPAEAVGWSGPTSIRPATWEADYVEDDGDAKHNSGPEDKNVASAANENTYNEKDVLLSPPSHDILGIEISQTRSVLTAGLRRVIAAEPQITQYDTISGDGDCGTGLKRGAEAIIAELVKVCTARAPEEGHREGKDGEERGGEEEEVDAVALVNCLANVIEQNMDGTSGALYAIFVNALARNLAVLGRGQQKLEKQKSTESRDDMEENPAAAQPPSDPKQGASRNPQISSSNTGFRSREAIAPQYISHHSKLHLWIQALTLCLTTLASYTPAQEGDRTLLDALIPFVRSLEGSFSDSSSKTDSDDVDRTQTSVGEILKNAVAEAEAGAQKTRWMRPKLGRAVYCAGFDDADDGGGGRHDDDDDENNEENDENDDDDFTTNEKRSSDNVKNQGTQVESQVVAEGESRRAGGGVVSNGKNEKRAKPRPVPDPGAWGLKEFLCGLVEEMVKEGLR